MPHGATRAAWPARRRPRMRRPVSCSTAGAGAAPLLCGGRCRGRPLLVRRRRPEFGAVESPAAAPSVETETARTGFRRPTGRQTPRRTRTRRIHRTARTARTACGGSAPSEARRAPPDGPAQAAGYGTPWWRREWTVAQARRSEAAAESVGSPPATLPASGGCRPPRRSGRHRLSPLCPEAARAAPHLRLSLHHPKAARAAPRR